MPLISPQLLGNFSRTGNPLPAQIWNQKALLFVDWGWTGRAGASGWGPVHWGSLVPSAGAWTLRSGGVVSAGDTVLDESHLGWVSDSCPPDPLFLSRGFMSHSSAHPSCPLQLHGGPTSTKGLWAHTTLRSPLPGYGAGCSLIRPGMDRMVSLQNPHVGNPSSPV